MDRFDLHGVPMMKRYLLGIVLCCLVIDDGWSDDLQFARDIQPVLAKHCFVCHGPDDRESGLGLHDPESATEATESGTVAIVPGEPESSELLRRVATTDESERMPPEGEPLSAEEISVLRRWIAEGARYERHWAFVAPTRPTPPAVQDEGRVRNPVDRFVQARLEQGGVHAAPPAEPGKLVRRLYLDLVGLLPPESEVVAFRRGDLTYSQVVDRLLASPHFGERWGRHWLDLARYADSFGYERDDVRPNAWRYRDWVVQSINRNQPYDEFVIEQLAGDLLPNATTEQQIAAGLHRMNIKNNESGINKEDYRNREIVDRVNTTATSMLGLTLGCCQCHGHKYDPLTQKDYYSLYAFFNNAEAKDLDIQGTVAERQKYELAKAKLDEHRAELDQRAKFIDVLQKHASLTNWLQSADASLDRLVGELGLEDAWRTRLTGPETDSAAADLWASFTGRKDDVAQAMRQLSVEQRHLPRPYVMTLEEKSDDRRKTNVLVRGDFKTKGDEVSANTPAVLPPLETRQETPDRLDLAHWIVSPSHPLAARVAVNHIWKHLMGRGIVTSMDDFGTQGQPPTHPNLLDWLAVEFQQSGWDRKHLIRLIVQSATYQQSSQVPPNASEEQQAVWGADNPLFAKQARFRVESEVLRDIFLNASELLCRDLGGPTIHPLVPTAVTDLAYKYKTRWQVSDKPNRYRRGIYIHFKRTNPYPTLLMFDSPESNLCQAMRNTSNTPLQALATMNDPVFVECAQALGAKMAGLQTAVEGRLEWLVGRTLSRQALPEEVDVLGELLAAERSWYAEHPEAAEALVGEYGADGVELDETAAWISVARAVLNLDEFVTRE